MLFIPVVEWIRQLSSFNTTTLDANPSVAVDNDGNMFVCYETEGTTSGETKFGTPNDIVVFKITPIGSLAWIKQDTSFNTSGADGAPNIAIDADGNPYVVYRTFGTVSGGTSTNGSSDIVVFKMNSNGDIQWIKQTAVFNTTSSESNPSIIIDHSDNLIIAYESGGIVSGGTQLGGQGITDIVVLKMSPSGNILWIKQQASFNTTGADSSSAVAVDPSNNIFVSYQTPGIVSGGTMPNDNFNKIAVFKMNSSGVLQWIRETTDFNASYSSNPNNQESRIAADSSGNTYVCYYTRGTISGGVNTGTAPFLIDIVIFKLDTNGNFVWAKQDPILNTSRNDFSPDIIVNADNEVFICYHTPNSIPSGAGTYGIVIAKLDSNGTVVWTKQDPAFNPTTPPSPPLYSTNINHPRLSIDNAGDIYVTYDVNNSAVPNETQSGGRDIVVFKLRDQLISNSFLGSVNPYVAFDNIVVYNTATVEALRTGAPLPLTTRVSWAPLGLPAGSLLRDLKRTVATPYSATNRLEKYRFQKVQYMLSADTEGISGGPADEDPWRTGYICTWAADGVPPVF